ncbi:MAG: hypothetical protein CSYNP_01482 [Syntrophus sp. SKADARSKE-3]|nr:hypothetical protein [Syntrophus sp. SKADARSKE-3]
MIAKEINCSYCGLTGNIDGHDLGVNIVQAKIFKHQGHNPFTGQLFYRCPSCLTTLQVNPMDVLKSEVLKGIPVQDEQRDLDLCATYSRLKEKLHSLRKRLRYVRSSANEEFQDGNMTQSWGMDGVISTMKDRHSDVLFRR